MSAIKNTREGKTLCFDECTVLGRNCLAGYFANEQICDIEKWRIEEKLLDLRRPDLPNFILTQGNRVLGISGIGYNVNCGGGVWGRVEMSDGMITVAEYRYP